MNHPVYDVLLWQAEQTNKNVLINISFFLWLISIPFVCICVPLSIYLLMDM